MDGKSESALQSNLSKLNQYLAESDANEKLAGVEGLRPRHQVRDQERLPPTSRAKASLLNANRSTEGYLNQETRVTPTRSNADDLVDRFSLPNTEESRRQRGKLHSDDHISQYSKGLFRPKGDSQREAEDEKGSIEPKRVSFYDENCDLDAGESKRSQERKQSNSKKHRLLNGEPDDFSSEAHLTHDMKVTDVFKHYDQLAAELKSLYSAKLQAAREEARKEVERANKEQLLREEVEAAKKQLEDEIKYYKEELEEERRKAVERNSELRKIRREKLTNQKIDSGRQAYDSKSVELDEVLEKCRELELKSQVLESTLTQVSRERDLLKEEMIHLQAISNENQAQLSASIAVREELSSVLKDIQRDRVEMSILLQNLAQNKETISTLTSKNEFLYSKLKDYEDENSKLSEALNEISGEVAAVPLLKKQIQELLDSLASREDKLRSQTSKAETIEKQLNVYKDKVDTLLGLNEFMEKSLKEAEEKGKRAFHERHDEVDTMKDRVQQMINENLKLKKKVNELEGQLEIADVEANQYKKKEEEQAEQISILHDDLISVSNQLSSLQSSYEKVKKENVAIKNVVEQLEDEIDVTKAQEEKAVRAMKAFEILLSDIASKISSAGGPMLKVPKVNLDYFNDTNHRDQFMNMLCAFEDGVKAVLDKKKRPSGVEDTKTVPIAIKTQTKNGSVVHLELIEKLKSILSQTLTCLEEVVEEPEKIREMEEVITEYCEVQLNMNLLEEKLLEKELQLNNSSVVFINKDKTEKARRSKDVNTMKSSLQTLEDRLEFLDSRLAEIFETVRGQLVQDHISNTVHNSVKDSLQGDLEDMGHLQTRTRNSGQYISSKATNSSTKTKKNRQTFYQVSEVEDVISNLIDSKGY